MDHGLKAGDVVQLKSGSPAMTIAGIDGEVASLRIFWEGKIEIMKVVTIVLKKVE